MKPRFPRKEIPKNANLNINLNVWIITFLFLGMLGFLLILVFHYQKKSLDIKKNIQLGESTGQTIRLELDSRTVDVKIPILNPSKYTAIIVEPRKHKALSFVLQNFTENLNEEWNFVLLYSIDNAEYVKQIFETDLKNQQHRFSFVLLGISKMTLQDYNCMFYNESFYDLIPTETFLVFQTDSIILRENKENLNDFLKYDYVGAPWRHAYGIIGYMRVGNGGLSLRKKSKMLELVKYKHYAIDAESKQIYGKYIAEDQFFCGFLIKEVKIYKPFWEKAKQFSIENVFHEKSFGVHACWREMGDKELGILKNLYPDIIKLQNLNT